MRTARALNSIISILFFALGVLLFFFTEKIYKLVVKYMKIAIIYCLFTSMVTHGSPYFNLSP